MQIPISERYLEPGENRYFYITNEFLKDNYEEAYLIENSSKNVVCDEEDILMTRTGNTGIVVTDVKGCFHNNFFKIKYDKNLFSKKYICYLLSSDRMHFSFTVLSEPSQDIFTMEAYASMYRIFTYIKKSIKF